MLNSDAIAHKWFCQKTNRLLRPNTLHNSSRVYECYWAHFAAKIHLSEKSAFRPCGRDIMEFFNSTGWAFYVQVVVPMRLPDAARLPGSNLLQAGFRPTSADQPIGTCPDS